MTTTPALNDDLASRLMDYGLTLDEHVVICDRRVVDEAASALEAQSKEIEALRAALEPFAEAAAYHAAFDDERGVRSDGDVTVGDLRRARTALKGA